MPATIQPQPLPATGVQPADIAIAATVQLSRVGQATRAGAGTTSAGRIVTADTFVASTDTLLLGDTTSNTVTLRMPRVSEYRRNEWEFERYAGANTFTVIPRPGSSDTIDGGGSVVVTKRIKISAINNATWHVVVTGN